MILHAHGQTTHANAQMQTKLFKWHTCMHPVCMHTNKHKQIATTSEPKLRG